MKIKIESLLVEREINSAKKLGSDNAFIVKDLKFNADSQSLKVTNEDSEILKCLKYCIREKDNMIDYLELSELIDTNNIIYNNFWNEEEFNRACKFEFRECFDLDKCKVIYA